MSASDAWWQEVYRRFDPWRPAEVQWRVERPRSPAARIAAEIGSGVGPRRYVLLGTPGSGKSTELKVLADLARSGNVVIAHDVGTHFSETLRDEASLQRVRPWEVLFLLGLAVFRAGEHLGLSFSEALCARFESAAARVLLPPSEKAGEKPTVSLLQLASNVAVLVGGAVGGAAGARAIETLTRATDAVDWTVQLGRDTRALSDQDAPVQELLDAVNGFIEHVQQERGPLLLVTDGLDRIESIETNRWLFERSRVLGRVAASTVFAAHLTIELRGLVDKLQGFHRSKLTNIQVLDPHDPPRPGSELGFLREVWERRTTDLANPWQGRKPLEPAELDRLALYSGGLLRDFAHLIQGLAIQVLTKGAELADADLVDRAIGERRLVREDPWSARHDRVLREVLTRRWLPDLSSEADGPEFLDQLVDSFQLLPYPNESTWWYPHPLLTLSRLRTG